MKNSSTTTSGQALHTVTAVHRLCPQGREKEQLKMVQNVWNLLFRYQIPDQYNGNEGKTTKTSDFPAFHYLSDLMTTSNVLPRTERGS